MPKSSNKNFTNEQIIALFIIEFNNLLEKHPGIPIARHVNLIFRRRKESGPMPSEWTNEQTLAKLNDYFEELKQMKEDEEE